MLTIRPIAPADEAAFVALHGRCTAVAARDLIERSLQAFGADGITPLRHVFVLHDSEPGGHGALLGAAALSGSTGLDLPRYSYRSGVVVHASAELKMFHRADTLLLVNDLTGCAELHLPLMARPDAVLAPQRLLVDAMLLFVAQEPDRFAPVLIAELPGLTFEGGGSPFWSALGRHFHAAERPRFDAFFDVPERSHIARLMPKHPLYSSFLGPQAHACIGQRALPARAAAEALQAQGFRDRGHLDIFDAGPIVEADVADLAAVRASLVVPVRIGTPAPTASWLVAGTGGARTSASLVPAVLVNGALLLSEAQARALCVEDGQRLRVLPQGTMVGAPP